MSGLVIGAVLAAILLLTWLIVVLARGGGGRRVDEVSPRIRKALTVFAEQSLELPSQDEILTFATEAAREIFSIERVVLVERGDEQESWQGRLSPSEELGSIPAKLSGVFDWFVHNPDFAAKADLSHPRFGAMRKPLGQLMEHLGADVLLPLVSRGDLMATLGLKLGRNPSVHDRPGMRLFRLAATAACANVRLHREAAHLVTLAKEVDLANAVQIALSPEQTDGSAGKVRWAGHYSSAAEASSDFWAVYPMEGGRVMVVIGDAAGRELAGAMVSAVVKSCTDSIFELLRSIEPGGLLTSLNRSLYQPSRPALASCFAAVFDPSSREIRYANAGHVIPYHLQVGGDGALGVLSGSGPFLGDDREASYPERSVTLRGGDVFVFFSDGLIKVKNPQGQELEERALQELLRGQSSADAARVRDVILEATEAHRAGRPLSDDQALVVVSI